MATEQVKKDTKDQGKTPPPASPAQQQVSPLMIVKRTIVDVVAAKIEQFIQNGELNMPKDYSVNNAIKAAWLVLQATEDRDHHKALEVCTRDSIANAILDMVVQGLNPIKNQCYFIVYGKTLTCQRSYFGSMAVAKMVQPKIDDFAFAVVYDDDKFSYGIKNGKKMVIEHEQKRENIDKKKIAAAYCMALDKDGNPFKTEIMTFEEIKQAWKQSKMNPFNENGELKEGSTHGKFAADMALKTVTNKCCKAIINASSDNALLLERINKNGELADRAEADEEIEELANQGEVLDVTAQEKAPELAKGEASEQKPDNVKPEEQKKMPGF